MAPTESGRVNRPAAPFHALVVEKMCKTRASPAGESGDRFRSALTESARCSGRCSRGFQVFVSESAAKKREIYVSQVKMMNTIKIKKVKR